MTDDTHPAKWSPEVLAAIAPTLRAWQLPVHDPFAGTGERLGRLCDQLGLTYTGTEIEPEFGRDARVLGGDSTQASTYPVPPHCVTCSPCYPNGMTDHFHARDQSRRHTYRQALAEILGHDRELHPNNMGRYGARRGQKALAQHYAIARRCVAHWPEHVVLNVSNFMMRGKVVDVVGTWQGLLSERGYLLTEAPILVQTRRQGHGANREQRVEHEVVLVVERA